MTGTVDWRRVAEAALHPVQLEILKAVAACDRLSPVQFCCKDGQDVSRVAYHFRALKRLGLLEVAGSAPKRGAIEHFYRLAPDARG